MLFEEVRKRTGIQFKEGVMTIGFARRATEYKRTGMLFSDLERLRSIARNVGPFQLLYSGKAHPRDEGGKAMIRHIFEAADALKDSIPTVYLEDYDMQWGKLLCSGVDLWLNTPKRPLEASGTSGMKAALNGVPSFSVPDGWWLEGHVEGKTGWAIGHDGEWIDDPTTEIASLYQKLEHVIVPMFYGQPAEYAEVMRSAIALNGSFFNAQRMLTQYVSNAYFPSKRELPQ
jgi:starch phosphorylase